VDNGQLTKILIVEDESLVAKDIEIRLKALGYAVSAIASSGEGAIQKAAETHPDLVLMDIVLKGDMDGVKTAKEIISRYDIPVLYLTAYADEKTLERAKITEPFGYILKPFEEKEVHSAIEIALYKHKTGRKLKENQRWLSTILKSIGDGLIVTDRDGFVTFINPVAEALTGWKHKKALGKNVKEVFRIIDEKKRALGDSLIAKVFQDGIAVSLANQILLGPKHGTQTAIDVSAAPIMDDKRNGTGSVLVFRDITEQKQLQKQLQHAQKMQAVGTLASGMAHEFNNSLAAIHGYVQLLVKEIKPEHPMAGYCQKISAKCKQTAELTQKILNYSRLDVGKRLPVEVNPVVEEVQRFLRQTVPRQIELESKLQGNLPLVMAEPTQLEQILLNLVTNALDAMPHGGKIHFRSRMVEPDEGFRRAHVWAKKARYVEVMVKDTGEGMPKEVLERVFDPFFTTKEPGKGTGLGLSITYSILENYGGYILAESQVGRGSCFRIYLPAVIEEQVERGRRSQTT
jgi:two-component system cell cycle sensor histidine kinase/response regulator CckA